MDVDVVRDVVAEVRIRRWVDRRKPHRLDAEPLQVVGSLCDTGEVADAVTVRVGEAPRIDLVDDAPLPPRGALRHPAVPVPHVPPWSPVGVRWTLATRRRASPVRAQCPDASTPRPTNAVASGATRGANVRRQVARRRRPI